jgi:HK97 family phage prohead protease
MIATEEMTQESQSPERAIITRTYDVDLDVATGRTIDVRIVPYGERATVADGFGGVARGVPYEEEWMPGVFSHQVNAAHRVLANVEHEPGIRGIVGRGLELREASDGFHGSFKALENPDGDKALMLINDKVFTGVSLEAQPVKNVRSASGVVQRVKANLRGIAFCRDGAFAGAQVLAVREAHTVVDEIDAEFLPPEIDPELVERCRQLGIAVPQRYQAHPETDTSAQADTSETAPATDGTSTSEVESP